MKGSFFYNYKADKQNGYNKFCYGVLTIEVDDSKELGQEAFNEVQAIAKKEYPDADNINFTAFNKI